jgi:glycosyltransferase involved in cell wall biosynthesis
MIRLSIVIPTSNRPKDIVERVGELLPQLVQGVDLLIIDNCSPVVVETLISENFPDTLGKITHIRNAVNIGGNANICRCFEVGDSDWIWLLGDDDSVKPDAIKMILAEIASHGEAISIIAGFNFSTGILQYLESY